MQQTSKQPVTIFEQIVFGQEITNENIVALAENLAVINAKIDKLLAVFAPTNKHSKPVASGEDTE